jgi:maltose alpha-D-glucosyltransferase / alpha-amylase
VPFLIEKKGPFPEHPQDFDLLHEMRDFLQWRCRDAILLAEANVPPEQSKEYFGAQGDRLQMMLNFPVNQRLWYALASADVEPLAWAIEQTANVPVQAQFVQFLRSHDECDLGRLSDEQRACVFEQCGPDKSMQLYNRGIRRRLAPMLGNDRRRLELAFSLLFSLPGTPMMLYGDEIGMGDDLSLPERESARTPMQWTSERHGGFTTAERPHQKVIDDKTYGYQKVNVAAQRRDPQSLLNWTERIIRMRKECPEIPWGEFQILATSVKGVLALRYDWRDTSLLTIHNFTDRDVKAALDIGVPRGDLLVDVFADQHSDGRNGRHEIALPPYGWRWFRVGSPDTTLLRTP